MIGVSVSAVLGAAAALTIFIGCAGVLALREPLARLHAAALVSAVPPFLLFGALALHDGWSMSAAKGALVVSVVVSGSPATTYAAGAAVRRWSARRARE